MTRIRWAAGLWVACSLASACAQAADSPDPSADAYGNRTGLPAYPNLTDPVMEPLARTDALGRWCTRFSADTGDSLSSVESWYRKILARASETDLTHDRNYANHPTLAGIKLALGIDYVAVYKVTIQAPTTIELYRCSPVI
jgi:hypothetical protein